MTVPENVNEEGFVDLFEPDPSNYDVNAPALIPADYDESEMASATHGDFHSRPDLDVVLADEEEERPHG